MLTFPIAIRFRYNFFSKIREVHIGSEIMVVDTINAMACLPYDQPGSFPKGTAHVPSIGDAVTLLFKECQVQALSPGGGSGSDAFRVQPAVTAIAWVRM